MPYFRYTGGYTVVYPEIVTRVGPLVAMPGDVAELDEAPGDGRWSPAEPPEPPADAGSATALTVTADDVKEA